MMDGGMMGGWGWGGLGTFILLFWIVAFIDLVLLGIWLWKQIKRR